MWAPGGEDPAVGWWLWLAHSPQSHTPHWCLQSLSTLHWNTLPYFPVHGVKGKEDVNGSTLRKETQEHMGEGVKAGEKEYKGKVMEKKGK